MVMMRMVRRPFTGIPAAPPLRVPAPLAATGLVSHVAGFAGAFRTAWDASSAFALDHPGANTLVLAGMGGSAAAADLVAGLAAAQRTPVRVHLERGYCLPAWVGSDTAVCCTSYSGQTEETLAIFAEAQARGLRPSVIASGGALLAAAEEAGLPRFPIAYAAPPRHALAWTLAPLLRLGSRLGSLRVDDDAVERAAGAVESAMPDLVRESEALARRLHETVPVISAAEFLVPVARRWKNQLNENANHLAFADELPEANHNSIVGLDMPREAAVSAVFLESGTYHPRNGLRMAVTAELYGAAGCAVLQCSATGEPLAQILTLVALGDLVSLWLAVFNGVSARDIGRIEQLKARLTPMP